ncbi:tryptophan synthase subunit alpha [Luteibaculum oceani]|uniref:Tryptophan synthase alpha chain n=1 Tax=Luteibaculum oceani TaxID=1294296 RepID=A0A5C6V0U4_9FLAO|nr:tryptophan synthase subunit alpha [Luteibaculum oceani]TXC78564.1 tryptophan synthase subunit alpha [Luteibaculum oceani]
MKNKLGIYFTAGYPRPESTLEILHALADAKVKFIEVGIPFSDPLADGPVIQESSKQALELGVNLDKIFEDLKQFKLERTDHPDLYLMGYLNSVLSYGVENFLSQAQTAGVTGVILPDLPFNYYQKHYQALFNTYNIKPVFLISPASSSTYIEVLDQANLGFIYVLSSNATTGKKLSLSDNEAFFKRLRAMDLKTETYLGFGIKSKEDITYASTFFDGGIIGSEMIRRLDDKELDSPKKAINRFMQELV